MATPAVVTPWRPAEVAATVENMITKHGCSLADLVRTGPVQTTMGLSTHIGKAAMPQEH